VSLVDSFGSEEVNAFSITVNFCTQFSLVNPPIYKSVLAGVGSMMKKMTNKSDVNKWIWYVVARVA
jgi:hypothetical protein